MHPPWFNNSLTLCLSTLYFFEGYNTVYPCVLLSAAAYQIPAVGRDGSVRPFEKPWFMVLLMFAGNKFVHDLGF
jgi:hypothetical protein